MTSLAARLQAMARTRLAAGTGVVTLALALRLWFATSYHPPGWFVRSDMQRYDRFARHLLDGQLDRWDAYTPAGYPAFLAAIYGLAGHDTLLLPVGWVQSLLGALATALAMVLAWRLRPSMPLALAVGVAVALHPMLVIYTGFALTETLFVALVLGLVLTLPDALVRGSLRRSTLAGLLLGVAIATRPNLVFVLPLLALDAVRSRRRGPWLAVLGACALVMAASGALSSRAAGKRLLLPENGGLNAYFSFADVEMLTFPEGGLIRKASTYSTRKYGSGDRTTEHPADDQLHWYAEARQLIAASPSKLLTRPLRNLAETSGLQLPGVHPIEPYWPRLTAEDNEPLRWFSRAFFALFVVPGAWAAGRAWSGARGPHRRLMAQLLASCALASAALLGEPRLRVTFDPLLIALTLDACWTTWAERREATRARASLGAS